ncbi:MAG: ATP-binding protein [Bacteroidetes bacterium]|nr:ATP-binding protein [Bacteroidota bacterium]
MQKLPNKKQIVIGIVGPESTGKSTLAQALSKHFQLHYVPEMAREYLNQLGRPYQEEDLKKIAKTQQEEELKYRNSNQYLVICDTTLLVIKVWSEYKYHRCDEWILKAESECSYDLLLLTDIDLPWVDDPMREHPMERKELFSIYYRALIQKKEPFKLIFGNEKERFDKAIQAIKMLNTNSSF